MRIQITDDFDPKKIQISGQCFRVKEPAPGVFRFISSEHVLFIKEISNDETEKSFDVSCSKEEWENVWMPYFDMERSYLDICKKEYGKHDFTDKAIDFGRGLRILKQDKWEMLISFIISQRKSIPAISSAVEAISRKFGTKIDCSEIFRGSDIKTEEPLVDAVYAFPTPLQMAKASMEDLKECGLGYRAPYVYDAIKKVNSGELDLEALDSLNDDELFNALMDVHGVGKKVSNCVCLFAYARMGRAPVDVWISRAIDEEYGGVDPFPQYGENAGIIQQYIFYYEKNFPRL
ncbi:DNA-3-methyladenine glycosylase family protein [Butyrivibrio sp. JL13D10]|uniref:DNA-3-methyladenine glycosylase family protein n=1 Tax=Butyrivibrio sp. JL13D10 TaxID=3236815 RepID=UPI0038B6AEBA